MINATANEETTLQPLSEFHLEMLSPNAAKLYQAIWLRMSSRNATTIMLDDAEASRRSRVLMQHIPAAQSELAKAGLFIMVPGINMTRYEFVSDPETEATQD